MDAELKGIEVETAFTGDDEFAVEYALDGELLAQPIQHFWEVAIERFLVSTLEQDFVAVAKDENAEAVPLGLVYPVAFGGNCVDPLGEHGKEWRIDGELHVRGRMIRPLGVDAVGPECRCPIEGTRVR